MPTADNTQSGPAQPDDGLVDLAPGVRIPPASVSVIYSSSSGPGGQNVNRRSTKCQLRINLNDLPLTAAQRSRLKRAEASRITSDGLLTISSDEHRSQRRNTQACYDRLREILIRCRTEPKKRVPTKPSRSSKERRLQTKQHRSTIKRRRTEPGSEDH